MHVIAELLEAVTGLGIWIAIGAVAVGALFVAGATLRGRSPRAGNAVALLGVAIPALAAAAWLGQRGARELDLVSATGAVREYHIGQLYEGERPDPGFVRIRGVARYEFGVVTIYGSAIFGTFSQTYCYPVVPGTRARNAPLVACSRGRSPGGTSEQVTLEGIIGLRPLPPHMRKMFLDRSNIEVAPDAMLLDEGLPPPSKGRAGAILAFAIAIVSGLAAASFALLRRPRS